MISQPSAKVVSYEPGSIQRAKRALQCSPFQLQLFEMMRNQSVPLPAIASEKGKNQGYTDKVLTEARTERELIWLIQVGLLRREVDGQGITDSFRLTPLGRLIITEWEKQGEIPKATWKERIYNFCHRWLGLGL